MKPISFIILTSAVHATCFDGNNGGCSHFCSEGVCSCPDCWTLDSDGKTCLIAPDKGNITCGASGPTIFLDKCVVPEVDQASIHLNHDNCSAVEDGTTHWKITPSSFYDCGTVVDTQNGTFSFSNTLHIGNRIANGVVIGRKRTFDFACHFNSTMTATSHYNSSNAITVSQTINAGNPFVDLSYSINFYDSADYTNKVDFSSTSITVGNTLFAQIEAPELINDTKFIVKRCTVTDSTEAGYSLMLVDNFCPIDNGLNFRWRSDSTSDSVVQFEYTNFIFPGSSETTEMTLDCEINLCHVDDSECLKGCEKHILVFPRYMADAYTISSSGEMKDVSVSAPSTIDSTTDNFARYTDRSRFAVVRGEMYVFGGGLGGMESNQKIAMLNGCEFTELAVKFTFYYGSQSGALAIDGGMQALVCFDKMYSILTHENKGKRCEIFDTFTTTISPFIPQYRHDYGKLAMYQGQPTSVSGSIGLNVGPFKKVETLTSSGWASLADHPKSIRTHVLIGLDSGAMIMAGGRDDDTSDLTRDIWLMKDGAWSLIGLLQEASKESSALRIENDIFIVCGAQSRDTLNYFPIEKIKIVDDEIINQEVIGVKTNQNHQPVLFEVSADFTC